MIKHDLLTRYCAAADTSLQEVLSGLVDRFIAENVGEIQAAITEDAARSAAQLAFLGMLIPNEVT